MDWSGMVSSLYNQFTQLAYAVLEAVLAILPDSPFIYISQSPAIAKILRGVNWVIPFDFIVSTFTLWLSAIAVYYAYTVILRFFKAID